jgi:thiol-disulfide isomerase/thioredoxin
MEPEPLRPYRSAAEQYTARHSIARIVGVGGALVLLALAVLVLATPSRAANETAPDFDAPDRSAWLNSPPLTLAQLRGKPVLIEFWTFGCSNCRNTLPWLKQIDARYRERGLTIVGVHTPEFAYEKSPAAVAEAIRKLGIRYPVLLDNDFAYWNSLANRYWPAFYLVDGNGRIVATRIGELHAGRRNADEFEQAIVRLLPGR